LRKELTAYKKRDQYYLRIQYFIVNRLELKYGDSIYLCFLDGIPSKLRRKLKFYHKKNLLVRSIEEDYVLKVESINGNYSVDVKSLKELVFFRSVLGLLYQTYADISAQL